MAYHQVTNQTQLLAAIRSASAGDTIVLASGNYGRVRIGDLPANLTIEAAAGADVQFDRLGMFRFDGLTIRNVNIGSPLSGTDQVWTRQAEFFDARNLVVEGVKVHGSLDGNPQNDSWGMFIRNMDGVVVRDSEFTELSRGLMFDKSDNLVVANNRFHNLEMDGTNFAAVRNVLVDGNFFTNFYPLPGSHPDAIQFWTNGVTTPNTDIVIRNNVMLQGSGSGTQGILLGEENGSLPYSNVTIENNLMYGADLWHGIAVYHAKGVNVANNTIVSPTTDSRRFWILVEKSDGVTVTKNVTDQVLIGTSNKNVSASDNLDLHLNPGLRELVPNLNGGALTQISDLLVEGRGFQPPVAEIVPPPINEIWGTSASDRLTGTDGIDHISGVAAFDGRLGSGTVDLLRGGGGGDLFILGDDRGAFYDDARARNSGRGDFAQILDFSGADGDRIQLAGPQSGYHFKAGWVNNQFGLQIFLDTNGSRSLDGRDELIGHVVGVGSFDAAHFAFVEGSAQLGNNELVGGALRFASDHFAIA